MTDKMPGLELADLATVRGWGWDDQRLQSELYRLDYGTMEGLTDEHSGLVEQWGPVFSNHPDSWRLLYTRPGEVVGYWHFTSLFEDQYQDAKAGTLLDVAITADRIMAFELPGIYNIYFAGICLRDEFRRPRALQKLLRSFLEVLESLARRQVFVGEICANAFTKGGASLCRSLGMKQCATHVKHGDIYAGWLVDVLGLPLVNEFQSLREAYHSAKAKEET